LIILGISCYYHDAAAALVRDGEIIAAAQEERFSRVKHDSSFPSQAVAYVLKEADCDMQDVDFVVFYDKPFLKFERILETIVVEAPKGLRSALKAIPIWIKQKLWIEDSIRTELGYEGKILYPEHHLSHAASAFFPSPFQEAAVLTIDGVGEWTTASIGHGVGNSLEILKELTFPHSLGLLYSAFTYHAGFKVNSGEYKLMGLAPYGKPVYADLIFNKMIDLKEDGSFRMDQQYFDYASGLKMTSDAFSRLVGFEARKPEDSMSQQVMDLAASVQVVTEEIMVRMAREATRVTGSRNLCLAGGVALNCVGNGRILREGIVDALWIQPASGDAGGALGAALSAWYQYLGKPRQAEAEDIMKGAFLGPEYSNSQIRLWLDDHNLPYRKLDAPELYAHMAELIDQGSIIGWLNGRMEFGPRALGHRTILADARNPEMQRKLNLSIKYRESFRPFAPAVLAEYASEYFDMDAESPYMLLTAQVSEQHKLDTTDGASGMDLLYQKRSDIPAVTHIDYSARVQTIDAKRNPTFWYLLHEYHKRTGCPVMINTSFNVRGEPPVQSPADAWNCFMATEMDVLVLENFVLYKNEQPGAELGAGAFQRDFQAD
jgi:carbamoyltransferase